MPGRRCRTGSRRPSWSDSPQPHYARDQPEGSIKRLIGIEQTSEAGAGLVNHAHLDRVEDSDGLNGDARRLDVSNSPRGAEGAQGIYLLHLLSTAKGIAMIAAEERPGQMPPPKDHKRKLVSLPPELAERVADYRFKYRHASEMAALRELIEKGLDAAEREEREAEKRR
jgi:hypothetical protein